MQNAHAFSFSANIAPRALPSADLALQLLGPSPAMSQLWSQVRRLAPHVRTLLLTGAPHSGQEAIARLLLDLSPQPNRSLLILYAADADVFFSELIEAPIFPADQILFFPEVERLSSHAQNGLLRLMRRRSRGFCVVAAAAEDLRGLVSTHRYAPELAEALSSVRLEIPALHSRAEDLPMLLHHMLAARCQALDCPPPALSEELLQRAMHYSWPGNMSELELVIEALAEMAAERTQLLAEDLEIALAAERPERAQPQPVRMVCLETVMREHVGEVLRACRGNKQRAAEILGISRSTLYRMLDTTADLDALPLAS